MRASFFFVVFALVFLTACNKDKTIARKLSGEWELVLFKISLPDGTSQYPVSTGTLDITEEDAKHGKSTFSSSLHFSLLGSDNTEIKNGKLELRENGNYLSVSVLDTNDQIIASEYHRIMVLTKTDLQIEYSDDLGRLRNLTFRRK